MQCAVSILGTLITLDYRELVIRWVVGIDDITVSDCKS